MTLSWPLDPTVYAGLAALAVAYWLVGLDRLDSRLRPVCFALGLLVTWAALETPLDRVADLYLQSVHMLQHVLLGIVAPPLLLLGLSPVAAARLARLPWVRFYTEPVPAQLIAATVMVAWHLPPLYEATLYSEPLHVFEHLSFIAAGLVFWWPVLQSTSRQARWQLSGWAKLVYLLAGTLPQDGVSLALIFSRSVFYEFYTAVRPVAPWDAAADQTIAGVVLMVFGKSSFVVAALAIFFRMFARGSEADVTDQGGPVPALRAAPPQR